MAAEEIGQDEIPLPFEHALILYLQVQNVGFAYSFIWPFFHPRPNPTEFKWASGLGEIVEYPHSMDLADDLSDLCAAGVLSAKRASPVVFRLGAVAVEHKEDYLRFLRRRHGVTYDTIREHVQAAFENPKLLFEECYKMYVENTY